MVQGTLSIIFVVLTIIVIGAALIATIRSWRRAGSLARGPCRGVLHLRAGGNVRQPAGEGAGETMERTAGRGQAGKDGAE